MNPWEVMFSQYPQFHKAISANQYARKHDGHLTLAVVLACALFCVAVYKRYTGSVDAGSPVFPFVDTS